MIIRRALILAFIFSSSAYSATLHVPGNYSTIQSAIDAANFYDTVLVDPGTYMENINFRGKAIIVKSDQGPENTVIDGGALPPYQHRSIVTFANGEGADSVLDGFTLIHGTGTYTINVGWYAGGGILCTHRSSPTICNNIIERNMTYAGAGIYCGYGTSPVIINNVIRYNSGEVSLSFGAGSGGGIYCYGATPLIENNIISKNRVLGVGGGINSYDSAALIRNNTINDNWAEFSGGGCNSYFSSDEIMHNSITGNSAGYGGAGIACGRDSFVFDPGQPDFRELLSRSDLRYRGGIWGSDARIKILNNTIENNIAVQSGGGIQSDGDYDITSSLIDGNIIIGNYAGWTGGGIHCHRNSWPVISNNIIADNRCAQFGGGIGCHYFTCPRIINNTIYGNWASDTGGGLHCDEGVSTEVTNTIFWDNAATYEGDEIWVGNTINPSDLTLSYSNVKGGKNSVYVDSGCTLNWGSNMLDANPLFADSAESDFHIQYTSPCRDIGDNSSVAPLSHDFEGDVRITYGIVDMGADEQGTHLYVTGDPSPGGTITIKVMGLPAAEVVLYAGTEVLDPPEVTRYGLWYLMLPIHAVKMGQVPASGLLMLQAAIPPRFPAPSAIPLQVLVGDGLSNLLLFSVD